jgi:hypothetical protein
MPQTHCCRQIDQMKDKFTFFGSVFMKLTDRRHSLTVRIFERFSVTATTILLTCSATTIPFEVIKLSIPY